MLYNRKNIECVPTVQPEDLPMVIIPDQSITLRQIIDKATHGQAVDGRELAYSGRVILRRDDYDLTDKKRQLDEFEAYMASLEDTRKTLESQYKDINAAREARLTRFEESEKLKDSVVEPVKPKSDGKS